VEWARACYKLSEAADGSEQQASKHGEMVGSDAGSSGGGGGDREAQNGGGKVREAPRGNPPPRPVSRSPSPPVEDPVESKVTGWDAIANRVVPSGTTASPPSTYVGSFTTRDTEMDTLRRMLNEYRGENDTLGALITALKVRLCSLTPCGPRLVMTDL